MEHQALKITLTLSSPVVTDSEHPIHLDALLAWARVQEAEDAGRSLAWDEGDDLPLAKAGEGPDWVWCASRLLFTPVAPRELINMQRKSEPEVFYRDFDEGLWAIRNKQGDIVDKTPPKINGQSGQFRAYQYYTSVQWMVKAEAWCIGKKVRIEQLLSRIEHVGKMGRNGFGLVSGISVELDPSADIKWAFRVLPHDVILPVGVDYAPVMSAPRAPYWDKQKRVMMQEPVL